MSIIEKVLARLDEIQSMIYENRVEFLRALQDCPKGTLHGEEIKELQLWRERLMGKIAVIVALASIIGSGVVMVAADIVKWKIGY